MREKYAERMKAQSVAMLNEILSAKTLARKRAIVVRNNPHFYLMFHEGVNGEKQGGCSSRPDESITQKYVALRVVPDREQNEDMVKEGGVYGLSV